MGSKNINKYTFKQSTILLVIMILLLACNRQSLAPATATATATATETITPKPTYIPPPTVTKIPTETPVPLPVSLSGTVFLSGDENKPFVTLVELRKYDKNGSESLLSRKVETKTENNGFFIIEDVEPDIYDLWVLLTSKPATISGCEDILPPDKQWRMGIDYGEGNLKIGYGENSNSDIIPEIPYLSEVIIFTQKLSMVNRLFIPNGFYVVLDDFEIKAGEPNKMDIFIKCE